MSVEPSWVILGAVILGGLFGLFQLPAWQGCMLAGIVIAQAALKWGQAFLIDWVNKLCTMARFVLKGGLTADKPGDVLAEVRKLPPLIVTEQRKLFSLAFFISLVFLMYALGRWVFFRVRIRPRVGVAIMFEAFRRSKIQMLLASVLGAINGYLIAHFLVLLLFPQAETVIKVPSGQLANLLDENLVLVLIGFILILIIFGLQASGRSQG